MTNLNKLDPFRDFEKTLTSFLGVNPWGVGVAQGRTANEELPVPAWTPRADVLEVEDAFLIEVELPQIKKENLKVSLNDGILTLSGTRESTRKSDTVTRHRQERIFGTFRRQFVMPEGIDETQISADFKEGILEIRIPKKPELQPKSFEIKVN